MHTSCTTVSHSYNSTVNTVSYVKCMLPTTCLAGPIALIKLNTQKKKKKKKKKHHCRYMGIVQYCQLIALSSNV